MNRQQLQQGQIRQTPKKIFIPGPQVCSFSEISPLWAYDFEWFTDPQQPEQNRHLELLTYRELQSTPSPIQVIFFNIKFILYFLHRH